MTTFLPASISRRSIREVARRYFTHLDVTSVEVTSVTVEQDDGYRVSHVPTDTQRVTISGFYRRPTKRTRVRATTTRSRGKTLAEVFRDEERER